VINYLKTQGMREIVDPFVGSGTTLAIANKYGMDAVGIDLDPKQCKRALKLYIQ
jgi:DNA modification methylase